VNKHRQVGGWLDGWAWHGWVVCGVRCVHTHTANCILN